MQPPSSVMYSSGSEHLFHEDAITYPNQVDSLLAFTSLVDTTSESLVFCTSLVKLGFDFLVDEGFVVFEILLDVDFELDDIV